MISSVVLDRPTKRLRAEKVALVQAALGEDESGEPSKSELEQGAIVAVKHRPHGAGGSYGFIRTKDGDRCVAVAGRLLAAPTHARHTLHTSSCAPCLPSVRAWAEPHPQP